MEDYNSIDEFRCKNRREPTIKETRLLYSVIWDKYIRETSDDEKKMALENDSLTKQSEIIERIKISSQKFKDLMKRKKNIISGGYFERWGAFKLFVEVNCNNDKELYRFREFVPNFFEGWEVEIFRAKLLKRIIFLISHYIVNKRKESRMFLH